VLHRQDHPVQHGEATRGGGEYIGGRKRGKERTEEEEEEEEGKGKEERRRSLKPRRQVDPSGAAADQLSDDVAWPGASVAMCAV
jgi:hypothetical protein